MDSTTTLDATQPAYVQTTYDGQQGPEGLQGPQGQAGEVSLSEFQSAIAGTSNNSNDVQPLPITISDPPTRSEVQQILDKLNKLIQALRRV